MPLPFFSVSVRKLVVMYFATFGMYEVYWFYRHWIAVRNFNQIYISPAARTVVAPIFAFGLFKRIFDSAKFTPIASIGFATALGTFQLVTSIAAHTPPPYIFLVALAVIPILPAQMLANRANVAVDPQHMVNSKLSRLNWIAVGIGGCVLLLSMVVVIHSRRGVA